MSLQPHYHFFSQNVLKISLEIMKTELERPHSSIVVLPQACLHWRWPTLVGRARQSVLAVSTATPSGGEESCFPVCTPSWPQGFSACSAFQLIRLLVASQEGCLLEKTYIGTSFSTLSKWAWCSDPSFLSLGNISGHRCA